MRYKFLAIAAASVTSVATYAQSNITIYGRADMSYIHKTNDLKAGLADEESPSRIGLFGEEDLGSGLKAFFQFEERFNIDSGKNVSSNLRWDDKSWVGLKSDAWGQVLFGRAPTALDSIYTWKVEAFGGDTISIMPTRRAKYTARYNNGMQYITPAFAGVKLIAHYALTEKETGAAQAKVPFGFAATGTWNALTVEAGWQKDTSAGNGLTTGNHFKTWLIDGAYDFSFVKVVAGYAHSAGYTDSADSSLNNDQANMVAYQVGAIIPIGEAATLRANIGRITETDSTGTKLTPKTHFGFGYWYALSKRTTLMANLSYDKKRDGYYSSADSQTADDQTGIQFAIRHDF